MVPLTVDVQSPIRFMIVRGWPTLPRSVELQVLLMVEVDNRSRGLHHPLIGCPRHSHLRPRRIPLVGDHHRTGSVVGRDTSGPGFGDHGLLAPRRSVDGTDAAFDMRSLGRHIEATSSDGGPHLTMREEMETNLIRTLIASYFDIVRQTIQDLIPKAIMHFLVNYTSQHVQDRLVSSLYKPDLFPELLNEDETLVTERARVQSLLDAYKEAFKTLSEVSLKSA